VCRKNHPSLHIKTRCEQSQKKSNTKSFTKTQENIIYRISVFFYSDKKKIIPTKIPLKLNNIADSKVFGLK
jgi:hypothetical protein